MIEPVQVSRFEINPYILLYGSFLIGALMRLLVRAGNAYRSQVNIYPSRWSYIVRNWDIFAVRSGIVTLLYSGWLFHPDWLSKGLVGIGFAAGIANWIIVTPNLGSSWGAGLFGDWGLDQIQYRIGQKWPSANRYLTGEVPAYDAAVVAVEKLSPERKVGE